MTTPIQPEQDPLEELKRMRARQANGERDPLEELRAMRGVDRAQHPAEDEPSFASKALGTAASLVRDIPGAEALQAAAAVGASHIPGWSESGPLSYREARQMIRDVEGSAPKAATIPARMAGGTIAALAAPTSIAGKVLTPAMQGAGYGVLSGALQSDLDAGLGERAKDAAIGGVTGAAAGKAGELVTNWIRGVTSPNAPQAFKPFRDQLRAADDVNYGQAMAEGRANGGTSPAVQSALNDPRVRPIAEDIRASFRSQGKPTDDASILAQVHRELSQNERALIERAQNAGAPRPMTTREKGDVAAVKRMLREAAAAPSQKPALTLDVAPETYSVPPTVTQAERETLQGPIDGLAKDVTDAQRPDLRQALRDFRGGGNAADVQGPGGPAFQLRGQAEQIRPGIDIEMPAMRIETAPAEDVAPLMPSFPRAVEESARLRGQNEAFKTGSRVGKTLANDRAVPEKAFGKADRDPVAFLASIAGLSPERAEAARAGLVARAGEAPTNASLNPFKLFGLGSAIARGNRLAPALRALDERAGGVPQWVDLMRAIANAEGHPTP